MTTYLAQLPISSEQAQSAARTAARRAHPARRASRRVDGKLALLARIDTLAGCGRQDLVALAATADIVDVRAGDVLGEGRQLGQFWWMPVDGWLLVSGDDNQAITVPTGYSYASGHGGAGRNRKVSALRPGRVLVCSTAALEDTLQHNPRLGTAVQASLVGSDV